MSVARQCRLLGLPRASLYYRAATESPLNLELMFEIDKQYLRTPFYGSPSMTLHLRSLGYLVNRKRVVRLMRVMALKSVCPGPHTSKPRLENKVYPYLLRGVKVERPNQVWSSDITYIPVRQGFMYLTAIMDWRSRYVLSHELSNTLDAGFCLDALEDALRQGVPEIFNTDQGSQYTSSEFTGALTKRGIRISMDGKGRAIDNVFIERLWRTIKYEYVYPRRHEDPMALRQGLTEYFSWYNNERRHSSLDNRPPKAIFKKG